MISKTLPVNVIDFLFCKGDVKTAKTVDDIDKAVKIEDNIIINFDFEIVLNGFYGKLCTAIGKGGIKFIFSLIKNGQIQIP